MTKRIGSFPRASPTTCIRCRGDPRMSEDALEFAGNRYTIGHVDHDHLGGTRRTAGARHRPVNADAPAGGCVRCRWMCRDSGSGRVSDAFPNWIGNASGAESAAVRVDRGGRSSLPDVWHDHRVRACRQWKHACFISCPAAGVVAGDGDGHDAAGQPARADHWLTPAQRILALVGPMDRMDSRRACGGGMGVQDHLI